MDIPPFGDPAAGASALPDDELDRICFRNLIDGAPETAYFKDLGSRFVRVSQGHVELFRASCAADVIGTTDFDHFDASHAQPAFEAEQEIIRTGKPIIELEEEETYADGRPSTWVVTTKQPLRDGNGRIIGTFGLSRSITERKRLTAALQLRTVELARVERQLRRLLEKTPDPIVRFDRTLRYTYANPAAQELLGLDADVLLGSTNRELGPVTATIEEWEEALRLVISTEQPADLELNFGGPEPRHMHVGITPEYDDAGALAGVFVIGRDITARKIAEDALAERAVHDPLTGLANRVLLADRIQHALERLRRYPGQLAVLFFDLDRFKVINDSLGHSAGDALLAEVGRRLTEMARGSDTVARFGGDEFVMLCERIRRNEDAAIIARRIAEALAEPFVYEGQPIHVSASIGITTTADPTTSPTALLRDADAAMYLAKQSGHGSGSYHFFDASVRARAVARLAIEGELRRSIGDQDFRLVYQPLVTLDEEGGDRVVGFEALLRWQHPVRGLLAPAEFMDVAEDTNLIVPIGAWVLAEACRQLAEWNQGRGPDELLTMSVNVSGRQLSRPNLMTDVCDALEQNGLDPRLLTLEITETALLEEATASDGILWRLAGIGVRIALDDFGTGYSSLGHLRQFPVNILKIDRAFVEGLDTTRGDGAIVGAVTAMAHALGMTTVGEGIETKGEMEALRGLGCDAGQGYLIAYPLPPDEIAARHLAGQPNSTHAGATSVPAPRGVAAES
jgi:diguanylate cyclase (GGDEF)-like protein/PAS domain S-box-containing protein